MSAIAAGISIPLHALTELWVHTGTACNLECPFCLEGSRPGDTRLERIKPVEIKPILEQAAQFGARRFGFTGGEPLIVKDIVKILEHALSLRPCLLLTNGTAPLLKRLHQLQLLKHQPHPLSFRVSLDYPDEQRHDSARGWGNFRRALDGLQLLHTQGFTVSIARQREVDENSSEVAEKFRQLLRRASLPEDLPVAALPDFGRPGETAEIVLAATELQQPETLMCSYSRMVVKRQGQLCFYACGFTDDDPRFDLGDSLPAALTAHVELKHHRCSRCLRTQCRLG